MQPWKTILVVLIFKHFYLDILLSSTYGKHQNMYALCFILLTYVYIFLNYFFMESSTCILLFYNNPPHVFLHYMVYIDLCFVSSAPQEPGSSRSSPRLKQKRLEAQTPQDIVRRSLRQKIREVRMTLSGCQLSSILVYNSLKRIFSSFFQSISRRSLPPIKRRTASIRNTNASAASSMLISDGETPRHLLRNILQTGMCISPSIVWFFQVFVHLTFCYFHI